MLYETSVNCCSLDYSRYNTMINAFRCATTLSSLFQHLVRVQIIVLAYTIVNILRIRCQEYKSSEIFSSEDNVLKRKKRRGPVTPVSLSLLSQMKDTDAATIRLFIFNFSSPLNVNLRRSCRIQDSRLSP